MSDDALLDVADLRKTFGGVVALDGLSVTVERGDVHGIIGPNGSGKSTFFNTVSGAYTPDGGSVRFRGTDVTEWAPHRIAREGMVRTFQIASPFEELTLRNNLLSVDAGREGVVTEERADDLLDRLEIAHVADHEAQEVSGGQRKLLELGRALMLDPGLVLLDEPMAGVNPALVDRILDFLAEMNEAGTTFALIEHDMDVMRRIADTITVFDRGRVIAEGSFEEMRRDERVRQAYLGSDDGGSPTPDVPADDAHAVGGDSEPGRLRAADVVAGYGQHEVLHGVSVESREGVTCVFGPNGSGKSTLLKTLNGLVPAWSGRIEHESEEITGYEPKRTVRSGIITVSQDGGVFGSLTVRENLKLGAYSVDDRSVVEERLADVFEAFPALEEKLDARARSLSGGQRMMLSFGQAMMSGATTFLLDEPSAGLAPSLVDDVFGMVDEFAANEGQVILVEQNVRAALRIADYVYILAQGEIQFEGRPGALADQEELMDVYLGLSA